MQTTVQVPIFPLPIAVFPSELVALHIFEPRYKQMIRWCRSQTAEGLPGDFAIFLDDHGGLPTVGCTVRLRHVIREYPDGRLDLFVEGMRRTRLRERLKTRAYDSAVLDPYEDETPEWDEALATDVFQMHSVLIRMSTGRLPNPELYAHRRHLSFYVAQSTVMCAAARQRFLEQRRENDRLQCLLAHMRRLVQRIEENQVLSKAVRCNWEIQNLLRGADPS
jgi:Lon protease-like protein